MTIGERIKYLRDHLKLTQKQFAAILDTDQGHISGIENGTKNPSKSLQRVICLIFYVNDIWLKTGAGEMFISPEAILKNLMAHFGEQAIIEAVDNIKLSKEKEDKITSIDLIDTTVFARRLSDREPEFRRMINVLYTIFSLDDERLKTWASYQFDRAFPADVVEDAQKKQQETDRQSSAG